MATRWQVATITVLCIAIIAAGFFASWFRVWHDENWLARSGGTVVFVTGSWLTVTLSAFRSEVERSSSEVREILDERLLEVTTRTEDFELPDEYVDALGEETAERLQATIQSEAERLVGRLQEEHEQYRQGQFAALRFIELFWLGTGTLIWAWGDLIQHLVR